MDDKFEPLPREERLVKNMVGHQQPIRCCPDTFFQREKQSTFQVTFLLAFEAVARPAFTYICSRLALLKDLVPEKPY